MNPLACLPLRCLLMATCTISTTVHAHTRHPPAAPAAGHIRDWTSSLKHTPRLFAKRALYIRTAESAEADKGEGAPQLARTLGWFHVMFLGVGALVSGCVRVGWRGVRWAWCTLPAQ